MSILLIEKQKKGHDSIFKAPFEAEVQAKWSPAQPPFPLIDHTHYLCQELVFNFNFNYRVTVIIVQRTLYNGDEIRQNLNALPSSSIYSLKTQVCSKGNCNDE